MEAVRASEDGAGSIVSECRVAILLSGFVCSTSNFSSVTDPTCRQSVTRGPTPGRTVHRHVTLTFLTGIHAKCFRGDYNNVYTFHVSLHRKVLDGHSLLVLM